MIHSSSLCGVLSFVSFWVICPFFAHFSCVFIIKIRPSTTNYRWLASWEDPWAWFLDSFFLEVGFFVDSTGIAFSFRYRFSCYRTCLALLTAYVLLLPANVFLSSPQMSCSPHRTCLDTVLTRCYTVLTHSLLHCCTVTAPCSLSFVRQQMSLFNVASF